MSLENSDVIADIGRQAQPRMKLAVMQPYLFPYLGYFQLMAAVDRFVFLDDVNFIKKGWINRNRILLNGRDHLITFNVAAASQNKKINELTFDFDERWEKRFYGTLRQAYSKAPFYEATDQLIREIVAFPERNVSRFIFNSFRVLCRQLQLATDLVPSSGEAGGVGLKGQERILFICEENAASQYVNPPGGKALYSEALFSGKGITLSFVTPELKPYPQFGNEFVPGLSIIDVMMFNDSEQVRSCVRHVSLLPPTAATGRGTA
jgi:hypothetical protein